MRSSRVSKERQQRFLGVLAEVGDPWLAAEAAGVPEPRLRELRDADKSFEAEWDAAQHGWDKSLGRYANMRATEGVAEPLIIDGKVVRDDNGTPISVQRHSDGLLLALLKAAEPERFRERHQLEIAMIYPRWLRNILAALAMVLAVWLLGNLVLHVALATIAQPR